MQYSMELAGWLAGWLVVVYRGIPKRPRALCMGKV